MSLMRLILPVANPDFEKRIDLVRYWLLEFPYENLTPEREVGISGSGEVILKMPYKRNYGYWVDNNLRLIDFKSKFESADITKEYFEEKWNDESNLP